jgi:hypothetical protein
MSRDIFMMQPVLWNRSFLAWMNLLLCIFTLIVAINIDIFFFAMLDMFMAGVLFVNWFADSIYQSQNKLVKQALNLNWKLEREKIINTLKQINKKEKK